MKKLNLWFINNLKKSSDIKIVLMTEILSKFLENYCIK